MRWLRSLPLQGVRLRTFAIGAGTVTAVLLLVSGWLSLQHHRDEVRAQERAKAQEEALASLRAEHQRVVDNPIKPPPVVPLANIERARAERPKPPPSLPIPKQLHGAVVEARPGDQPTRMNQVLYIKGKTQ
jgi:hypothetical protein